MRLRLGAGIVVFLGSYFPLTAILLAQDFDYALYSGSPCWPFAPGNAQCAIPLGHPVASLGSVAVCAACFVANLLVPRQLKARGPL